MYVLKAELDSGPAEKAPGFGASASCAKKNADRQNNSKVDEIIKLWSQKDAHRNGLI